MVSHNRRPDCVLLASEDTGGNGGCAEKFMILAWMSPVLIAPVYVVRKIWLYFIALQWHPVFIIASAGLFCLLFFAAIAGVFLWLHRRRYFWAAAASVSLYVGFSYGLTTIYHFDADALSTSAVVIVSTVITTALMTISFGIAPAQDTENPWRRFLGGLAKLLALLVLVLLVFWSTANYWAAFFHEEFGWEEPRVLKILQDDNESILGILMEDISMPFTSNGEEIVGTWNCTVTTNSGEAAVTLKFIADGAFAIDGERNAVRYRQAGTYSVRDGKLILERVSAQMCGTGPQRRCEAVPPFLLLLPNNAEVRYNGFSNTMNAGRLRCRR